MSTPGYPSVDYEQGFTIAPQSAAARVRLAANGRAHVQHLGEYDDSVIDLVHPVVTEAQLAELRAHWDNTKDAAFLFTDAAGRDWLAEYASKPIEQHRFIRIWSVTVRLLLRRLDQ